MGLLDYSKQNPWVSDALATISQGLLSYGSGNQNMMAQLPQYLAERQRYRKDDARQTKMDQRQEQIWQMQQEEAERTKNKDAAQKRAAMGLLGGPAAPNGMSQAQFGGAPTQPGLLGNFDQPTQSYIKTLVDSGEYGGAIDTYGKLVTSKPEGPNSSLAKAKADLDRGYITPEEYQAYVNKETYIAPKDPPQAPETIRLMLAAGIDPNSQEGKAIIQGKLAGSNGITIGPDGTIQIGGPAGGKVTETQAKAANQATMLDEALNNNEALLSKGGINALRMAGADTLSQYGPIPQLGAQTMLSAEEKQFQASRSAALESLANMITGAAFTEEQKRNFTKMLPAATDDAETSAAKIKSLRRSLNQLKKNAGPALDQPAPGAVVPSLDGNGWDDE